MVTIQAPVQPVNGGKTWALLWQLKMRGSQIYITLQTLFFLAVVAV